MCRADEIIDFFISLMWLSVCRLFHFRFSFSSASIFSFLRLRLSPIIDFLPCADYFHDIFAVFHFFRAISSLLGIFCFSIFDFAFIFSSHIFFDFSIDDAFLLSLLFHWCRFHFLGIFIADRGRLLGLRLLSSRHASADYFLWFRFFFSPLMRRADFLSAWLIVISPIISFIFIFRCSFQRWRLFHFFSISSNIFSDFRFRRLAFIRLLWLRLMCWYYFRLFRFFTFISFLDFVNIFLRWGEIFWCFDDFLVFFSPFFIDVMPSIYFSSHISFSLISLRLFCWYADWFLSSIFIFHRKYFRHFSSAFHYFISLIISFSFRFSFVASFFDIFDGAISFLRRGFRCFLSFLDASFDWVFTFSRVKHFRCTIFDWFSLLQPISSNIVASIYFHAFRW